MSARARALAAQWPALTAALWLFVLAFAALAPGFYNGGIISHSSNLNTVWAEGFAQQLAEGHVYPRYLPELNQGLGSPVFYFYAPLPFYMAAPLVWLTGNASLATILTSALVLALSGIAAYTLLRDIVGHRIALPMAALYMLMPYHFVLDVWVRGAFGEQLGFVFLPLGLLALRRLPGDPRYAAGLAAVTAGQVLAHLPSTLIFIATIVFFAVADALARKTWRVLILAGFSGAAGALAASIYVLPALAAQSFIHPERWQDLRPAEQYVGRLHDNFQVVLLAGLLPSVLVAVLAASRLWSSKVTEARRWLLLAAAVIFLVSPLAIPFWSLGGILNAIQFPWRSLMVLDLAVCVLAAMSWASGGESASARRLPVALAAGAIVMAALSVALRYQPDPTKSAPLRDSVRVENLLLAAKADAPEYLPACMDVSEDDSHGRLSQIARVSAIFDRPHPEGSLEHFFYPFLTLRTPAGPIPFHCAVGQGLIVPDSNLAAGEPYTLKPESLPVERRAAWLSLFGAISIGLLFLWGSYWKNRQKSPLGAA